MPVQVTYPGVYIEELPSGDHTISGVATAITAFVGRAPIGPMDEPITVFSFGDYERQFGGLTHGYPMSYAVRDFFLNGGAEALIVRAFKSDKPGSATLTFPEPPPPIPEKWMVEADVDADKDNMTITGDEIEPEIGDAFTVQGDKSATVFNVRDFTAASGNTAAQLFFYPKTQDSLSACAKLSFERPSPAGWAVATKPSAGSEAEINGADDSVAGEGAPKPGDRLTVAGDPSNTVYTVKEYTPPNPSADPAEPASIELFEKLTPANWPQGAELTIHGLETPPPVPFGTQVQGKVAASGTDLTLTGGTGNPVVGDVFTVAGDDAEDPYAVTAFDAATRKVTFTPATTSGFAACAKVTFERLTPQHYKVDTLSDDNTMTIDAVTAGEEKGTILPGALFNVDGSTVTYQVRVYDPSTKTITFLPAAENVGGGKAITFIPPLTLAAANPGEWGNGLEATVDYNGITEHVAENFEQYGLTKDDLFNLTVTLKRKGRTSTERFINVSVADTKAPNRLDRILAHKSQLVRTQTKLDGVSLIPPSDGAVAEGSEGVDSSPLDALTVIGDENEKTGMYMLEKVHIFNLLCIPPDQPGGDQFSSVYAAAAEFCEKRRAMLIVDPPNGWADEARAGRVSDLSPVDPAIGISGTSARSAAVYFPRVVEPDLEMGGQPAVFPPCGIVAGVMAATDVARGVWKAPAGQDAGLAGVTGLEVKLSDPENGLLNPLGINCLRNFPVVGPVIWGARTLRGADQLEDDYKYVNVRRLTNYIELSLLDGTKWAVFEPNAEPLWSSLRLSIKSFMADLARQGAFYDYDVVCDASTTTARDIELGVVNVLVRFAPVKPAEFVVLQIQQQAAKPAS